MICKIRNYILLFRGKDVSDMDTVSKWDTESKQAVIGNIFEKIVV